MQTFNPNNLRDGFYRLLEKDEYRRKIENGVDAFLKNKNGLEKDPDFIDAIEILGELITSRGYSRKDAAVRFKVEFEKKLKSLGSGFFRTEEGQKALIDIVVKNASRRKKDAEKQIKGLLAKLSSTSIRKWTEHLYAISKRGKTEVLGKKGRDNYLRDMGYFDRIPIDVHEKRFIIRTGIYHSSSKDSFDPLEEDDLQDALVNFCDKFLRGINIRGIDISKSPGIVDLIIWHHCADLDSGGFQICAAKPKCLEDKIACPFSGSCLFSLLR